MGTIIVCIVLAVIVAAIIAKMVINGIKGKSSTCSCGCSGCKNKCK